MPQKVNMPKLVISLTICLGAGFLGSIFTSSAISTWYQTLNKPAFNPPNWVFGPVWTILYILLGISLYLIWQKGTGRKDVRTALTIFGIHLGVNVLWSLVFFGGKDIFSALITILVLLGLITIVIIQFSKIDKRAGLVLLPYLLWVAFATILNYNIWQLNMF